MRKKLIGALTLIMALSFGSLAYGQCGGMGSSGKKSTSKMSRKTRTRHGRTRGKGRKTGMTRNTNTNQ